MKIAFSHKSTERSYSAFLPPFHKPQAQHVAGLRTRPGVYIGQKREHEVEDIQKNKQICRTCLIKWHKPDIKAKARWDSEK